MTPDSKLDSILQNHLSNDEIQQFHEGDKELFATADEYHFFRRINNQYLRADVVLRTKFEGDKIGEFEHPIFETTEAEIANEIDGASQIKAIDPILKFEEVYQNAE